ncbi:hypothetical protein WOLCODRAFT_146795 [Wolfiporia cocos MD-104 SS10]|uniref:Uncharacterized protein n=1 Tax=Wolfiporia cocos (strain MD-104) TaxID=742152 RepID=A0A2H3J9N8_WOLCO|nr:hypothetical protein WOLCODRAFT_146795 [Wolfiporia cocos MD-104 SS10]
MASDVLVTLVTWYKLHHHKARLPRLQNGLSPAQSLIRDAVSISRIMLNLREACFMPNDPTGYELGTETLGAVGETQQSETRSTAVEFPMIASRPEGLRTSLSCGPAPSSSARQGNAVHILYMDVATSTLEYGSQGQELDDHQNHDSVSKFHLRDRSTCKWSFEHLVNLAMSIGQMRYFLMLAAELAKNVVIQNERHRTCDARRQIQMVLLHCNQSGGVTAYRCHIGKRDMLPDCTFIWYGSSSGPAPRWAKLAKVNMRISQRRIDIKEQFDPSRRWECQ